MTLLRVFWFSPLFTFNWWQYTNYILISEIKMDQLCTNHMNAVRKRGPLPNNIYIELLSVKRKNKCQVSIHLWRFILQGLTELLHCSYQVIFRVQYVPIHAYLWGFYVFWCVYTYLCVIYMWCMFTSMWVHIPVYVQNGSEGINYICYLIVVGLIFLWQSSLWKLEVDCWLASPRYSLVSAVHNTGVPYSDFSELISSQFTLNTIIFGNISLSFLWQNVGLETVHQIPV